VAALTAPLAAALATIATALEAAALWAGLGCGLRSGLGTGLGTGLEAATAETSAHAAVGRRIAPLEARAPAFTGASEEAARVGIGIAGCGRRSIWLHKSRTATAVAKIAAHASGESAAALEVTAATVIVLRRCYGLRRRGGEILAAIPIGKVAPAESTATLEATTIVLRRRDEVLAAIAIGKVTAAETITVSAVPIAACKGVAAIEAAPLEIAATITAIVRASIEIAAIEIAAGETVASVPLTAVPDAA
jgi:hypothetical protein